MEGHKKHWGPPKKNTRERGVDKHDYRHQRVRSWRVSLPCVPTGAMLWSLVLVASLPYVSAYPRIPTCPAGTYLHKYPIWMGGQYDCPPCPDGTFMPVSHSNYSQCYNCTQIKDPTLEVIIHPCEKTRDTDIQCVQGFYRELSTDSFQKSVGLCKGCTVCDKYFHEVRSCQNFSNTYCCPDVNYDFVLNEAGLAFCRQRPWMCRSGQYWNTELNKCDPCPANMFMSQDYHTYPSCWPCQSTLEEYLPLHTEIIQQCNSTNPTLYRCKTGFYVNNSVTIRRYFESHTKSYKIQDIGCSPCQTCQQGTFVGRPCSTYQNTVCCPQENMTVIDGAEGATCQDAPDAEQLLNMMTPSLGELLNMTTPSLGERLNMTTPRLKELLNMTTPSRGELLNMTTPSVEELLNMTTPSQVKDICYHTESETPTWLYIFAFIGISVTVGIIVCVLFFLVRRDTFISVIMKLLPQRKDNNDQDGAPENKQNCQGSDKVEAAEPMLEEDNGHDEDDDTDDYTSDEGKQVGATFKQGLLADPVGHKIFKNLTSRGSSTFKSNGSRRNEKMDKAELKTERIGARQVRHKQQFDDQGDDALESLLVGVDTDPVQDYSVNDDIEKAVLALTCHLSVTSISGDRPETFPLSGDDEENCMRTETGQVIHIEPVSEKKELNCECDKCQKPEKSDGNEMIDKADSKLDKSVGCRLDAAASEVERIRASRGNYEAEVTIAGELGLHESLLCCKKNPGHPNFIPVRNFNIEHLPSPYRDNLLVNYCQAQSDLTCRLLVSHISEDRPETWPDRREAFPFSYGKGKNYSLVGTGWVRHVYRYRETNINCRCDECLRPGTHTPKKAWGEVLIQTASHVVWNSEEARHTKCQFFYDSHETDINTVLTLTGGKVTYTDIKEDRCIMTYVTHDLELLDRFDNMYRRWEDLHHKVYNKYMSNSFLHVHAPDAECDTNVDHDLCIIVSHPHGCSKVVTVGAWIDREVLNDNGLRESVTYRYNTPTCPGSAGAGVLTLNRHDRISGGLYYLPPHSKGRPGNDNNSGVGEQWTF